MARVSAAGIDRNEAAAGWRSRLVRRGVRVDLNEPPDISCRANRTLKQYATCREGQAEHRRFGLQRLPRTEP